MLIEREKSGSQKGTVLEIKRFGCQVVGLVKYGPQAIFAGRSIDPS